MEGWFGCIPGFFWACNFRVGLSSFSACGWALLTTVCALPIFSPVKSRDENKEVKITDIAVDRCGAPETSLFRAMDTQKANTNFLCCLGHIVAGTSLENGIVPYSRGSWRL